MKQVLALPLWAQSMTARVTARVAASLALALGIAIGALALGGSPANDRIDDLSLRLQAQQLLGYITVTGNRADLQLPRSIRETYAAAGDTMLYSLLDEQGRLIIHSNSSVKLDAVEDILPDHPRGTLRFRLTSPAGAWITYNALAVPVPGGATLIVAHGEFDVLDMLREIYSREPGRIWWLASLVFGLPLLVLLWSLRSSLLGLRAVTAAVRAIQPGAITPRLPAETIPLEARPAMQAINEAFERLGEAVSLQRDFTATVAHELRGPLAMLRHQVQTLDDQTLAAELRHDIDRMARLVNQLLRLAQIEAFDLSSAEKVDLCAVARDVLATMAPAAIAAGVEMALDAPPYPVMTTGNPSAIWHALRNLVENAQQHAPAGSLIEVSLTPRGTISVADRGPGVPAVSRPHVFERFWRGTQTGTGSGLGLAIVARVAAMHGGTVAVADRPGGGAVFTMSLPPRFCWAVRSA